MNRARVAFFLSDLTGFYRLFIRDQSKKVLSSAIFTLISFTTLKALL